MRRRWALAVVLTAVVAAGCTYELRDVGVTSGCGELRYVVDPGAAGAEQLDAVHGGVARYGDIVNRAVVFDGYVDGSASDRPTGDVVLLEFRWPDDAPLRFGFAEPQIEEQQYVGGFVYLHPSMQSAPAGIVERLTMHELGHLGGLADVDDPAEMMDPSLAADDWGPGDRFALSTTHPNCGVRLL